MTKKYVKTIILIAILTLTFIVNPLGTISAKKSKRTNIEEFNIWLSKPIKGEYTAIIAYFPKELETPCCFEITIEFPSIIDFGIIKDLDKESDKTKKKEIFENIRRSIYLNGTSFANLKYAGIWILSSPNRLGIYGAFPEKNKFEGLRFYFSDLLKISFKESGKYTAYACVALPLELHTDQKINSNTFIVFNSLP